MQVSVAMKLMDYGLLMVAILLVVTMCGRDCRTDGVPEDAQARLGLGTYRVLSLSDDGSFLAVGTALGVGLYDAQTFQLVWFKFCAGPTTQVSFIPHSDSLAALSGDQVIVWDIERGRRLSTLVMDGGARNMVFSPDGDLFAVLGDGPIVSIVRARTGSLVHRLTIPLLVPGFRSGILPVGELDWSSDGSLIAAGSPDGETIVWQAETGEQLYRLPGSDGVAFSPDGTILVTATSTETLLWDTETGAQLVALDSIQGTTDIAWSPDGVTLAIMQTDTSLSIWEVDCYESGPGKAVVVSPMTLDTPYSSTGASSIPNLAFGPDGKSLYAGTANEIVAWDLVRSAVQHTLVGMDSVTSVTFGSDGTLLASGTDSGAIIIWDTTTHAVVQRMDDHLERVDSIVFTPDGERMVSSADDGSVIIWSTQNWEVLRKFQTDGAVSVATHPDSLKFAFGVSLSTSSAEIRVMDIVSGQPLYTIGSVEGRISTLAWSPDGKLLAWGMEDGRVTVWDTQTNSLYIAIRHLNDYLWNLTWSPDGKRLASVGNEKLVIWQVETGVAIDIWEGPFWSLAWSPDWRIVAYRSVKHTEYWPVTVRDMENEGQLRQLTGHLDEVVSITFGPNSSMLATGAADGSVLLWDLSRVVKGWDHSSRAIKN